MCRRKTFTLIYRVNFCNMSYFSQGLFHCFSAFRFFFNCLVTQRTMPCSCHVRTMLLPCWRRGESESCFPSGGDRGAVTHACVFTCSPPKQRHALDSRPCVELMAFTRLAGQLWLFFFFLPNNPDEFTDISFTILATILDTRRFFRSFTLNFGFYFFGGGNLIENAQEFLTFLCFRAISWTHFPHSLTMLPLLPGPHKAG